jgi:hypothetical protein
MEIVHLLHLYQFSQRCSFSYGMLLKAFLVKKEANCCQYRQIMRTIAIDHSIDLFKHQKEQHVPLKPELGEKQDPSPHWSEAL